MFFRGENPPNGAIIDYWLGAKTDKVTLAVYTTGGELVQTLPPTSARGLNRIIWNLRHAELPVRGGGFGDEGEGGGSLPGPYVSPGTYIVRLTANGRTIEQRVDVRDDPRISISNADREIWSDSLRSLASTIRQLAPLNDRIQKATGTGADLSDLKRQFRELQARITGLYTEIGRWTGRPNTDQLSELKFYTEMAQTLTKAAANY
jgi:hypothetical protein